MRVSACQLPDEREAFEPAWRRLVEHLRAEQSQLLVLPELIGSAWFPSQPVFDQATWEAALQEHDDLIRRFDELDGTAVIGSRPVELDGLRLNRGFSWTAGTGVQDVHDKYYMPNEPAYFETRWFNQPARDFSVFDLGDVPVGVMVCTDVMFNEWARHYGRQGALVVAVPRTSDPPEMWNVALRMAAVASGAFVISSNRSEAWGDGSRYGGPGMVISPDGTVLATTSSSDPTVTVDIELSDAVAAKDSYPRYVRE